MTRGGFLPGYGGVSVAGSSRLLAENVSDVGGGVTAADEVVTLSSDAVTRVTKAVFRW